MAGMLPGVGLPPRRRMHLHCQDDPPTHRHPSLRDWPPEPSTPKMTGAATLDETALRARQRLEQKLGYFRSPARLNIQPKGGRGFHNNSHTKDTWLGSKILGRPWRVQRNISESERQVCAICLEGFQAEQQVMGLSCSHKYHSKCLLPWLAAHPHCPCCRSPVKS